MNNINIPITPEKSYIRIRTIIILAFSFMLLVAVTLTDYYSSEGMQPLSDNVTDKINDNIEDYHVLETENGYYGVADKSERVVIEPVWDNVRILSVERFIVSSEIGGELKTGIIDGNSNAVVPFIFENFKTLNSEYMAGYIKDSGFILFDRVGNLISDKIWTDYEYSDKVMFLRSDDDEYHLKNTDGNSEYEYISLHRTPGSIPLNIEIDESDEIADIGIYNIERIADITDKYLNYLIAGGTGYNISDITTEQYQSTLSVNDMFRDCNISRIWNFDIEETYENMTPSYNVKVVVEYDYRTSEIELENISSEITLNIVKDENNRLVLKSINKIEL